MLKIIQILSGVAALILSSYSLFTGNSELIPYIQFFLGLMMLVMGIEEIRTNNKRVGYICLISSGFIFIVLILKLVS